MVLEEKLLKNDLHNGMHRGTMLGASFLLGFFLHNDQVRSSRSRPGNGGLGSRHPPSLTYWEYLTQTSYTLPTKDSGLCFTIK